MMKRIILLLMDMATLRHQGIIMGIRQRCLIRLIEGNHHLMHLWYQAVIHRRLRQGMAGNGYLRKPQFKRIERLASAH